MGFLSRLFRPASAVERLRKAEAMIAAGEVGLARLELQAALAATELTAADRQRAEALATDVGDWLAAARVDEAAALVEAGELAEAERQLEVAEALLPGPAMVERMQAVRNSLERNFTGAGSVHRAGTGAGDDGMFGSSMPNLPALAIAGGDPAADVHGDHRDDDDGDDDGDIASELSPFEQALLTFPPEEAERWDALAADDRAVHAALAALGGGEFAAALTHWQQVSASTKCSPLVQRELGRSLLLTGDHAAARAVLEAAHAADPESIPAMQLLADARLLAGDAVAAGELASVLLATSPTTETMVPLLDILVRAERGDDAIDHVEAVLARNPKAITLWEVLGNLAATLGHGELATDADSRGLRLFREQCGTCGPRPPHFPASSAGRLFEAELTAPRGQATMAREQLLDLGRLLVANDPERRPHWRARLAAVEGV